MAREDREERDMPLRQAGPSDARRLAEIHIASWQLAYRGIISDRVLDNLSVERRREDWEAKLDGGVDRVLVIERESRVIGFAAFGGSRDEDADDRIGEIRAIHLVPEEWRKGYGSALMEATVASLREEGFADVTLWVLRENRDAQRFYEAKGFEADGATKVDTRRDGAERHEVRYHLSLVKGSHARVGC